MASKIKGDKKILVGRILSGLISVPFVMSSFMKFSAPAEFKQNWAHMGWAESMLIVVGILELASVVTYLIPQTAVLGAILLTGYMGGAIATHLRMGEPAYLQVVFGIVIWAGLYLRDARLRAILPLRK